MKLALDGGEKTISRPLGKPWPIWDDREEKALLETLHSGMWWRGGAKSPSASQVARFEDEFLAFQGGRYCVCVTNGTQAIECVLKAFGVGRGDEVLVPSLTFVASATAIALVNATPVFVDVDPRIYNICPEAKERATTPKTKAAVVAHNGVDTPPTRTSFSPRSPRSGGTRTNSRRGRARPGDRRADCSAPRQPPSPAQRARTEEGSCAPEHV